LSGSDLLFLFTSNIRPLYAQDLLDVVAAAPNTQHSFRYDERHLDANTRERLRALRGTPILVHFSLQQEAHYQDPVFIPVRTGAVEATRRRGGTVFIDFSIGGFVALPEPGKERHALANEVRTYTEHLRSLPMKLPYEAQMSIGPNVLKTPDARLETGTDELALFRRITQYLYPTEAFKHARFYTFLGFRERGGGRVLEPNRDGTFVLGSGRSYDLELFHNQPGEVTSTDAIDVSVDGDLIRPIGTPTVEIGSRYDSVSIPLHARPAGKNETLETAIAIALRPPAHGPRTVVSVRLRPPRSKLLAAALLSAFVVTFLGTVSVMDISQNVQVASVFVVALLVALLQFAGLYDPITAGVRPQLVASRLGGDASLPADVPGRPPEEPPSSRSYV